MTTSAPPTTAPPEPVRNDDRDTRRLLRLATVVIAVMLAIGVLGQAVDAGCFQTSISAYYWTAAHSVFVAALCSIGVCLVVNRGSTFVEDTTLNLAGFFAFGVAMVPTPREPLCGGPGLVASFDPAPLVRNGGLAVLGAAVVSEVLQLAIGWSSTGRRIGRTRPLGWLLVAGFTVWYLASPATFLAHGHAVSAVTMFLMITVAVVLNGFGARRSTSPRRFGTAYYWTAATMAATLVAAVVLGLGDLGGRHLTIVAETLLIVEFTTFWLIQTVELWDVSDRQQLTPAG